MSEDLNCYVLIEIAGPFGMSRQVSARMRASEAAMTAGQIQRSIDLQNDRFVNATPSKRPMARVTKVEVVRLQEEDRNG